jgi:hypothetical protein
VTLATLGAAPLVDRLGWSAVNAWAAIPVGDGAGAGACPAAAGRAGVGGMISLMLQPAAFFLP